jgi:ankyrin repeat protein
MHLALHPNTSLDLIQVLLKACPNVVSEPNKEGLMPIHAACRYCCDKAEIIELLINAKPSVLRCRTKMGNLVQKKAKATPALVPNESFAKNNQHLVLAEVVSSSWRSSQVQNTTESEFEERSRQLRDGSYPLHIAIANGAPFRVIEKLATAAPDVLTMTDKFGRTCLHLAVANEATLNLESSTETLNSQETHSKQLQRITLDILELLHFMNRNQIGKQDKSKNLPLHTAMQGGRSVECVDFLIRGYPQAVDMRNIDGLTPSELARKQCDRINKSD